MPGSLSMVLMAGALTALIYIPWRADREIRDLEFLTWACEQPIEADAAWSDYEAAGCAPADVAAEVTMFQASSAPIEPDATGPGRRVFENVPTASPEFSLVVLLPAESSQLVLLDGDATEPVVIRSFNGDSSGTRWTSYFPTRDGPDSYILLAGGPE